MAIADAKKSFVWYNIGDFSSLNDASVFSDTDFASQLANDELDIPPSRPLPNTDIEMPFMFIADEIFALSKHLMKSFSKSGELAVEEKVFNYRLKRARLCIECAFGMIVKKYQIWQQKLKFDLTTSHFIVATIICLHNFLITSAENNMDDVNEEVVEGNNQNEENQNLRLTPVQQRQLLTAYFSSDAGSVDWQLDYI
ncbi:uncharacterized protein LOC116415765 [Nasonia vitripennis]|uniref:DDE Tnp4 domain-containing protein n=1 Tax=Nasonia vitripennis TaxID=7425 RepID=A0A7M7PXS5_NASVI|nr:uncharacterized protein LOC116415765 [Nasonia vitripennis]